MGWLAVFVVSIILLFWDIPVLDPILAIVINLAVLILVTVKMVDVVKVFLQRVPEGVNVPLFRQKILSLEGPDLAEKGGDGAREDKGSGFGGPENPEG